MSEWRECWPPNEAPSTRVRATVVVPIRPGVLSVPVTVEDSAGAFTELMQPAPEFDFFDARGLDELGEGPIGGTWYGEGEDFTVEGNASG